jgi:hypothetical protein
MLRKDSLGRPASGVWRRRHAAALAASLGVILCGGVSADTLAQPRDTALERRAADYVRFREDVAAVEATPFESAKTTREAHKRLSAHNSKSLSAGWVAYAALVAADTPEFAKALNKEMDRKKGAKAFLAELAQDPTYARKLKGADAAIQRVLEMTADDAGRFMALGEAFKQQAYAMQKTKWGKERIAAASERLTEAESFARSRPDPERPALSAATEGGVTSPMLASAEGAWSPDWGSKGRAAGNAEPNAQVILDRVLNLAARYAVGGMNEKIVEVYAKNDRADNCLSMASLTLRQCIAATRAPYEEAFCIGEHGLNDVASCMGWVAGAGSS